MNIYIGNLALEVTEEELRRQFIAFGAVGTITIMSDKYIGSGQLRKYGFVEMLSTSDGEIAVAALNGKFLRHQTVNVVQARPLSDKEDCVSHRHSRSLWTKSRARERSCQTTSL